jgi:hypothetical protein
MRTKTAVIVAIAFNIGIAKAGLFDGLVGFTEGVSKSDRLTFALYPAYGPGIKTDSGSDLWGFGAAAVYQVSDLLYVGARVDYLASEFWAPSATVSVQKTFSLFPESLNLPVTLFGVTGAVVPISGAGADNGDVGAIAGSGIALSVWRPTERTTFSIFYESEYWTNLKEWVHHPGVALTIKF